MPFSANNMYAPVARGVMKRTKKYNNWLETNIPILQKDMDKASLFPLEINVTVVGGRNFNAFTKNDVDNLKKPICDLLVDAGIIPDDRKEFVNHVSVKYLPSPTSKGEPLTLIEYFEPEPEEDIEWTASYPWDKS